jgi:hypothetical protein
MKIVQVTSEANASPIITALTSTSADRNIDHGDNSRSAAVVDFSDLLPLSAGLAAGLAAASDVEVDGAAANGG